MTLERRKEELKYNSFEVLTVFASILITFGLIGWSLGLGQPMTAAEKAKWKAEILAYSLWQLKLNKEPQIKMIKKQEDFSIKPSRGLASAGLIPMSTEKNEIGTIGMDPWNQPYHYIFKNDKQLLFIWSSGPNLKDDSKGDLISFLDDDIGFIIDLKLKR